MDENFFKKLSFLTEQLALLEEKEKNGCYSKETLALSVMLKTHSTSCYGAILKNHILTLPSVSSLRRICQGFDTESRNAMRSYLIEKRKKNSMRWNQLLCLCLTKCMYTKQLTSHPTLLMGWHPTKMNLQRQF